MRRGWISLLGCLFAATLASASILAAYRRHRHPQALFLMVPGIVLLLFGVAINLDVHVLLHTASVVTGGVLVASAHVNSTTQPRHVVVARGCRLVTEQSLDPLEDIVVRVVTVAELRAELRSGRLGAALQAYLALDHAGLLAPDTTT